VTFDDALRLEVNAILADPLFLKMPVLSNLLRYLARRSVEGNATPPSQFEIAVDALGRRDDFDESIDSYARTQVARLRSKLETYYHRCEPVGEGCVYIKPGDYRLRLGSRDVVYPRAGGPSLSLDAVESHAREQNGEPLKHSIRSALKRLHNRALAVSIALVTIAALISIIPSFWPSPESQPSSAPLHSPSVQFQVDLTGFTNQDPDRFQNLKSAVEGLLEENLTKAIAVHNFQEENGGEAEFTIQVILHTDKDQHVPLDIFLKDERGRTLYQATRILPLDHQTTAAVLKDEFVAITSPPGIISRHQAKRMDAQVGSGYECFVLTEVGFDSVGNLHHLLEDCLARYPQSQFYPYLKARALYLEFQKEAGQTAFFKENSAHWRELGAIIEEYPQNPYLVALAAKVLLGNENCVQARPYVERVLRLDNAYPTLELALAIEVSSCDEYDEVKELLERRTFEIVAANREPHALLKLHKMLALISYGRMDLLSAIPKNSFTGTNDGSVNRLSDEIAQSVEEGEAKFEGEKDLQSFVWSETVRTRILTRLRSGKR